MTPEHIERNALQAPDALAVIDGDRQISRSQLHHELACISHALHELGVGPGTRVALACEHAYVHWLLVLACERLGAVSDAIQEPLREAWASLHHRADLVATTFAPPAHAARHLRIDQAWLDGLLTRGHATALPWPAHNPDAPARVSRTSGTTGNSLRVLLSRADVAQRIHNWQMLLGLQAGSRYLMASQPSASSACHLAAACMQVGAVLVLPLPGEGWQAIVRHEVTHTVSMPGRLSQWLAALPDDFVRPASLRVLCGGARVSAALRQQTLQRLATSFEDVYASNEAGLIAIGQSAAPGAAAMLWPGVQVEVVDEHHTPLPSGAQGRIRVRAPGMAQGYLDSPAATAAHFRDGWFYPGDLGTLAAPLQLRVTGRDSEVLNLGGIKVSPEQIEERLCLPGIPAHELAVCALPETEAQGADQVWVALCGSAAAQQARVLQALAVVCRDYPGVSFCVIELPVINPQAPGKLSRRLLRELVSAARDANAAAGG